MLFFFSCLLFEDGSVSVDMTNEPPKISLMSPNDGSVYAVGDEVLLWAEVYDDNDQSSELLVEWSSSIDGVLNEDALNESAETNVAVTLTTGSHDISLVVEDSGGLTATETIAIVVENSASSPECTTVLPENDSKVPYQRPIELSMVVEDFDTPMSELTVTWESNVDGELGSVVPDDTGFAMLPYSFEEVGVHTLSVTATDLDGNSCMEKFDLEVVYAPMVEIESPQPNSVFTSFENVVFTGTAKHEGASPLTVQWSSDIEGVLVTGQPANDGSVSWVPTLTTFGEHQITLKAEAEDGLSDQQTVPIVYNATPEVLDIEMVPTNPGKEDILKCIPTYQDLDGGTLDVQYRWRTRTGNQSITPMVSDETQSSVDLSTAPVSPGDSLSCSVTVSDEYGSATTKTASVTIQ